MNATINVLFYIKRAKINSNGLVPIFIRITVDGKRIDKSTGKYVLPDKWSVETSRLKGNSEESCSLNNHLDLLRNGVFEIEKTMLLKGLDLNFENFKNDYNLGNYTALPYTAKPVSDFKDKNMAWYIVTECIKVLINSKKQPSTDNWYNVNLPKDVKKIYERIVEGKVDNNS